MNNDFKYTTAAESSKPGYLKAKFDRIKREQREESSRNLDRAEAAVSKIESILKAKVTR